MRLNNFLAKQKKSLSKITPDPKNQVVVEEIDKYILHKFNKRILSSDSAINGYI